jgi:lipoyl synthase
VRDPRAGYRQSLATLRHARNLGAERALPLLTKSSLMLGLGEERVELSEAFADLRSFGVEILTLGQYLRPSLGHLPVERFYPPEEFEELRLEALGAGFTYVASGPMVRSSYRAGEFFLESVLRKRREMRAAKPEEC